jgi:hypothetical protein
MESHEDYDRRLAEIHLDGGRYDAVDANIGTDVRCAEFRAMLAAFLGENFDVEKQSRLETLHTEMLRQQADLADRLNRGEVVADEYVDQFNAVAFEKFAAMEAVLGEDDYLKLFGPLPDRSSGFIDRDAFLRASHARP